MAILTKNALSASNQASFPNNTTGAITPQILRDFNQDVIDTLVDSLNTGSYAITTGSNDFTQPNNFTSISASSFVSASEFVGDGSKLTNITASVAIPISDEGILQGYATQLNFSGSNISASLQAGIATISVNTNNLVTTSSFNSFSQSVDGRLDSLEAATSSYANSASVAAVDAAQQSQINSLIAATSSLALTSLNAFTASQETKDATLELYTASVDTKFSNIGAQSGSWDNTSLNSFTASQNTKNSTLATYTASLNTSITSLNTYTASNDTKWSNLGSQSGSWITESETGSFARTNVTNVFTADQTFTSISASGNIKGLSFQGGAARVDTLQTQIPANPGDLTILIPNGNVSVSSSISATGTFTSSLQQGYVWVGDGNNRTILVATSSFAGTPTDITSLNAFTASQDTKNSTLASYTGSNNSKWDTLQMISGSWITETETASFARTNVDNNFSVNQTFTNITAVSASFQYVQTTYETSSVIYSSGSNQFGDELSDIQTLSGSVKVQGTLTINGLPVATGSTDISSLNAFTASQETKNSTLATYTASVDSQLSSLTNATASYAISSSVAAVDAGQQSQIDNLIAWTSSVVPTNISSLNAFTASQETKNSTLATYTASVDSSLSNINSFTASNGNTSLNSYTASNDTKWSNLAGQTGSYVTSAITASSLVTASVNLNTITFTKGDASTFNITVDTGSGGGGADLTSLNAFTASQETKDLTLASVTSSLNSATASLFTSASLALVTASASGANITFTKGDTSQFTITIATGSFVSASYAETSSITNNVVVIARNGGTSTLAAGTVVHITSASGDNPIFTTASFDTETLSSNTFGLLRYSSPAGADVQVVVSGIVTGVDTNPANGYVAGDILYLSSSGQFTNIQPQAPNQIVTLGQVLRAQQNNGSIYVSINNGWELNELHNVQINTPLTGDLLQYESSSYGLWKNKSIEGAGITTTSSFNTFTQSVDTKFNTLGGLTGSYATTGSNTFVGNQILTGSLIISSSATVDLQVTGAIGASGNIISSGSNGQVSVSNLAVTITSNAQTSSATYGRNVMTQASGSTRIGMSANPEQGSYVIGLAKPSIFVSSGSISVNYAPIQFERADAYTDGRVTFTTPVVLQQALTGSLTQGYVWAGGAGNITTLVATSSFISTPTDLSSLNAFTASQDTKNSTLATYTASVDSSLSNINTFTQSIIGTNPWTASIDTKFATLATQSGSWVTSAITASSVVTASVNLNTITFTKGDASTFALTVNTGSGGGGGAAFPFTGNAVITGSLGISGSMFGGVIALSVASTTASVDFSAANIFILTLPSASTHINPTNIRAGQTVNIQITQPTPGTGSVTFPSNVKFAGGNDYQATATGSAIDMLTLVSYDGTNVLATSIKNFL